MADNLSIEIDVTRAAASLDAVGASLDRFLAKLNSLTGAGAGLDAVSAQFSKLKLDPSVTEAIEKLQLKLASLEAQKVADLQKNLDNLNPAKVAATAEGLQKVRDAAAGLNPAGVKGFGDGLNDTNQKGQETTSTLNKIIAALTGAAQNFSGTATATKTASGAFGEYAGIAKSVSEAAAGATTKVGALGAGIAALGVVIAAGGIAILAEQFIKISEAAIKATEEQIKFTNVLNAVSKSDLGNTLFKDINEQALRTGISFDDVAGSAKRFGISASEAGISTEKVSKIFGQLNVGFKAAGLSTDETNRAFLALDQTLAQGRVGAQELVNQLGNAVPGALDLAAKAVGVTTRELKQLAKSGELLPTDFVTKFGAQIAKTFPESLISQSRLVSTEFDRFGVVVGNVTRAFGSGNIVGLTRGLADLLAVLNNALQKVAPAFELVAATVGDLVGGAFSTLAQVLKGIAEGFDVVATIIGTAIKGFVDFASASTALNDVVKGVGQAFTDFLKAIGLGDATLGSLGRGLGVIVGVLGTSAVAVYALSTAIGLMSTAFGAALLAIGNSTIALVTYATTSTTVATITGTLSGALGVLRTALTAVLASLGPIGLGFAALGVILGGLGLLAYADQAAKVVTTTKEAESASSLFGKAVAQVAAATKSGREALTELANGFGTLAGETLRYKEQSEGVKRSLLEIKGEFKDLQLETNRASIAQENTALSFDKAGLAAKSSALQIQAQGTSLKDSLNSAKASDAAFKSAASAVTAHGDAHDKGKGSINSHSAAVKDGASASKLASSSSDSLKQSVTDNGVAHQRATQAISANNIAKQQAAVASRATAASFRESRQALEEERAELQKQQQEFKTYGLIITDTNARFLELALGTGKQGEAAGNLAKTLDLLTRSSSDVLKLADEQIAADKAKVASLEAVLGILEKTRIAEEAKKNPDKELLKLNRETTEALEGQVVKLRANALAVEVLSTARARDLTLQQAAAEVFKNLTEEEKKSTGVKELTIAAQQKATESLKGATTEIDKNKNAQEKAAEAAKKSSEANKEVAKQTTALASGLQTAADRVPGQVASFDKLSASLLKVSEPAREIAAAFESITGSTASLSLYIERFSAAMTGLKEPTDKANPSLKTLGEQFTTLAEKLPPSSEAITSFAVGVTASVEPTATLTEALIKMAGTNAELAKLGGVLVGLKDSLVVLTTDIETIVDKIDRLTTASGSAATALGTTNANAATLRTTFEGLVNPIDVLIGKMEALKIAADKALEAARAAAAAGGGGGGGSTQVQQGRDGGMSTSLGNPMSVSMGAFANAPHFAEGTANTNNFLKSVAGGGIPSILHANEAVVPLPRGGAIPVEFTGGGTDDKSISALTSAISAGIAPLVTARSESPGLRVSQSSQTADVAAPVDTGRGGISSGGNTHKNYITINVTTPDADSFRKSKDQISTETYKSLREAFNRNG